MKNDSENRQAVNAGLKARALLTFVAGIFAGALIWWASPFFSGEKEAWNALGYYSIALCIAGFVAALISPKHFWLAPLGIHFGQSIYAVALLPTGSLLPFGLVLGSFFCILALAGAAGAFGIWRLRRRT